MRGLTIYKYKYKSTLPKLIYKFKAAPIYILMGDLEPIKTLKSIWKNK